MSVTALLLLLRITLVPVDSHYPNRVYYCLESRVFYEDKRFYCYQQDNEPLWVELDRPVVIVTEPVSLDPYAR